MINIENLPQGWFLGEDISVYRNLVKLVPNGGSIIELGVWKGRSLCSVSDIIIQKKLKVYAVDTFKGNINDNATDEAQTVDIQKIFKENIKKYGLDVNIFVMSTNEASKTIPDTQKFDLVFIDADHSYEAVSQDLENWIPKCSGTIAGHDYNHEAILKAVNEKFKNVQSYILVWWVSDIELNKKGGEKYYESVCNERRRNS